MMRKGAWIVIAGVGLVGFSAPSCSNLSEDCEFTLTCVEYETATGGSDGGDGDETGGVSGDGDGDVGGGGIGGEPFVSSCNDECDSAEVCKEDTARCVQCLTSEEHCGDETPVCDTGNNVCVECLSAGDCGPDAPVCEANECVGCSLSEDCSDYSETPVCDDVSGACIQCLDRTDCSDNVCERSTNTCLDRPAGDVGVCGECEYDDDCQVGQLCVEQSFEGTVVGNFCTWRKDGRAETLDASCFMAGEPYAGQTPEPVASVEGQTSVLCILATTTCPAFVQHRQSIAGCENETPASNDACGISGIEDGLCRENTGGDPLCTYPCGSDEDCSGTFACLGAPDGYCAL